MPTYDTNVFWLLSENHRFFGIENLNCKVYMEKDGEYFEYSIVEDQVFGQTCASEAAYTNLSVISDWHYMAFELSDKSFWILFENVIGKPVFIGLTNNVRKAMLMNDLLKEKKRLQRQKEESVGQFDSLISGVEHRMSLL